MSLWRKLKVGSIVGKELPEDVTFEHILYRICSDIMSVVDSDPDSVVTC